MTSAVPLSSAHRSRGFADVTGLVWLSLATRVSMNPPSRVAMLLIAPACPLGPAPSVALPVRAAVPRDPAAFQCP